jgi:abortive infection bacteriophage resistance protein
MTIKIYTKSPLSIQQQIKQLEVRGLVFKNKKQAFHYLEFISYYRFCGYALEFEENSGLLNQYKPGTTFEQVLDRYTFDRKLRLLVIDAIERIEIAIRTVMTNYLALRYGSHWYTQRNLFLSRFDHTAFIQTLRKEIVPHGKNKQKKCEQFIQEYYDHYTTPEFPPSWMIAEILSLGTWSMLFAHLKDRTDQKAISKPFDLSYSVMTSWLHSLTYLRNLCAHHNRLWNRRFLFTPLIAKKYVKQLTPNNSFSAQAAILRIFMGIISPESHWSQRLWELINTHQEIAHHQMGFRKQWNEDPFWNIY